jgi:hypothetical protein
MEVSMPDDANRPTLDRRLFSRPRDVIEAEQKRHDRAYLHGILAALGALVVGGALAFWITHSPFLRGISDWAVTLLCVVLIGGPLCAAFVLVARAPPAPFDALDEGSYVMDKKQAQWRVMLASQSILILTFAVEAVGLWPMRAHSWLFAAPFLALTLVMVFFVVVALYVRLGWMNPDLRLFLDDEVTRSFRARAQKLGYLLLLFIFLGLSAVARINPQAAVRYMPLGLALGCALPIFYFVYLDWQASRSG